MKTILFYVLFFQIRTIPFLLSEIPPNMEHPIYPTVFHQIKQTPCTCVYVTSFRPPFISSFPSLPPPHYHLSFLLPWYCLCVFLFSTYVFYFSPWRNTHTSYPRSPKLLFPRADGIISMQIHTGHTLVWISSRDESRSSRESRKSNDISWIPFENLY